MAMVLCMLVVSEHAIDAQGYLISTAFQSEAGAGLLYCGTLDVLHKAVRLMLAEEKWYFSLKRF